MNAAVPIPYCDPTGVEHLLFTFLLVVTPPGSHMQR